jgi:glycosyltransferase involved in cell wall biosynthesis
MMSEASVSVIIPAYRASATIGRALDSLLGQTRPPEEILIIDDGSPEDLAVAMEPYRDRVTLIRKPNGGAASARNLGIERAGGNLIAFLDADDYWERTKLEWQLDVFRRHPEVGLVASRFFSQSPGELRHGPVPQVDGRRFGDFSQDRVLRVSGLEVMRVATRVWTSTVIVRREALGDHRFVSGLEPAEDRDLWVRLIAGSPVYILSEPLATAVLEPGSLSRSDVDTDYTNMLRVVHRHADILGQRGTHYWEALFFRLWAANHLGDGRPREALNPAWNRLRRQPTSVEGWRIFFKCALMATASWRRGQLGRAGSQAGEA